MILFDPGWMGSGLRIIVALGTIFGVFVYLMVWAERKVSAFIQGRLGPNRVGPFGLFQNIADAVKFVFKENLRPMQANRFLYALAPWMAVFPAVLAFAVVPFGARRIGGVLIPLQIADVDVGVLFTLSIASMGVFSLVLAGWSANSKYPLLGGLRAAAQFLSYEIPLGLAILSVIVLAGSARLGEIVALQSSRWFVFLTPLGFIVFLITMFAETNRLPFDLAEGETEIIGYHAEYSGMKFAMFFMAEYANMFTVSCLVVLLFFGGWELLPFFGWDRMSALAGVDIYADPVLWLLPTLWFCAKVLFFLFLFIWVRWTLPRFRYDQLMTLGWKKLIPLGFLNLLLAIVVAVGTLP